jgi:hypothetical protein
VRSDCDPLAIVTLEAALFFSLPTWLYAVDAAWPANNPVWFGVALIAGASLALVVCHVLPAVCGPPVLSFLHSRVPRAIRIAFRFGFLLAQRFPWLKWLEPPEACLLDGEMTLYRGRLRLSQRSPAYFVRYGWPGELHICNG